MILSILIPTVPQRTNLFLELHSEINKQLELSNSFNLVEVISDDAPKGTKTTGQKRNDLLNAAQGEYVWFIDDDDMIMPNAIYNIITAYDTTLNETYAYCHEKNTYAEYVMFTFDTVNATVLPFLIITIFSCLLISMIGMEIPTK
jgi:hypothetical protein